MADNARALVADRYTWPRIGRALDQIIEAAVAAARTRRRTA
jgi:hypothetical protein